ncbi:MAG: polysaccharide deacetylase family protein, partial [Rhodospirillaceae bacterium]
FFIKHYDVVSLDQVLASRRGTPLPSRPLLITFDDGWSDTLTHAAPVLHQWGLPAVCFVIGDVLEEKGNNWWQNDFTLAWRKNAAISADIATAWNDLRPDLSDPSAHPPFQPANSYLAALAMLQDLPPPGRTALARTWDEPVADEQDRQMLSPPDVIKLREAGWAIGAHGASHMPLTLSRDVRGELAQAYKRLQPLASDSRGGALTMSFPHGRYSPEIVAAARACGYGMMFTSDPHLMDLRHGRLAGDVCGRIEIATRDFSRDGAFMPVLLALHLFRRPVSRSPRCNP